MNIHKKVATLVTLLAFLTMLPVIQAAEGDQATKLTFSKSVQIPGRVLPAGTYWFMVENSSGSNTNIVRVYNADRTMLYATLFTIGEIRSQATDDTAITFVNRGSMQPETLVSWFYPGHTDGHEFLYSQPEEHELAQLQHRTVMASAQAKHSPQSAVVGD
jgi:hypothetical protein